MVLTVLQVRFMRPLIELTVLKPRLKRRWIVFTVLKAGFIPPMDGIHCPPDEIKATPDRF